MQHAVVLSEPVVAEPVTECSSVVMEAKFVHDCNLHIAKVGKFKKFKFAFLILIKLKKHLINI